MLDVIGRAILHQQVSETERQDMNRFLNINPPPPLVTHLPYPPAAHLPPPSYVEAESQGHSRFLALLPPLQNGSSDSGSSIKKTSTHGTIQTASSGQPSATGSLQASPSMSSRRERSSIAPTGPPRGDPSASAHSRQQSTTPTRSPQVGSASSHRHGSSSTDSGVGPGQPGAEGDIHDLLVPDPHRDKDAADDRVRGNQSSGG